MQRQIIQYINKEEWLQERLNDITSTEVSALFDMNPYISKYELWHHKKNRTMPEFEENQRMKWGVRLQDAIAEGIAIDHNLKISKMTAYIRIPKLRIGSSFDYAVEDGNGLLEVKNVDGLQFKLGWIAEGDYVEAPPHIELQVQHEMLVSGRQYNLLGALIGGNDLKLIERMADSDIHKSILKKVAEFWDSIEKGIEPSPDYGNSYEFISKLMGYAEPGKVLETNDEDIISLTAKYKELSEAGTENDKQRKIIKAQLLTKIGDCEKVKMDGYSISASTIGPKMIEAYERSGYRDFRVYKKG